VHTDVGNGTLTRIFSNKAVLNASPSLPFTFLFIQLSIAVVLLHVSALFSPKFPIPSWDLKQAKELTPCVAVGVIGLVFNTLCLRDVDASFFQVSWPRRLIEFENKALTAHARQIARGLVLPLTIAVSACVTRRLPGILVLLAAGVVTAGFLIGISPSSGSLSASPLALSYGVFSSLMTALHVVQLKNALPYVNNSSLELAYWGNGGSAAMLAPFIFLNGELAAIQTLLAADTHAQKVFVVGCLVTGVTGFFLSIATLVSIKVTSPITHMFSSVSTSLLFAL
jgi:solute carrier family 35 (GDP-fucose transporter), member C1